MDFVDFSINRSFSKKSLLFVQVVGSVAAFHKNPVVELPIVIGTHPFLDEPSYPASSATNDNNLRKRLNANSSENAFGFAAPSAPPMPNENSTLKSPYSAVGAQNNGKLKITEQNELFNAVGLFYFYIAGPPSYEAAMQFGVESERNFIPNYPMFKPQTSHSNHN